MSHAPLIKQYVIVSRRGKGRGRSRDHSRDFGRGCGLFEGGRDSYDGRQIVGDKGPGNKSIEGGIITSLRSAGRSLVALNGHSWLMLILLLLVILPAFVLSQLLTLVLLALPMLFYHRRNMIECISSSSLRTIIQ